MNDIPQKEEALRLLRRHWGHAAFREGQWEIIETVLAGRDVLAVLPTGGGKSIGYQIPALMLEGVTLVVSPLIALMQDQVQRLKEIGIRATFINSTLSNAEIDQRWTDVEFGRYRLVYVAPERLQSEIFLSRVERLNVRLVAIDEAHCISEWGYDFRPAYLDIAEIRPLVPEAPFLAVTATATPPVRDDIWRHLALRDPLLYVKGFDRPNVIWSIFETENKRTRVGGVLKGVEGAGIVYAATRRGVENWQAWLESEGEEAVAYHGGMSGEARTRAAEAWVRGESRVMVATNAFGMGIDKPDVRFVIHVDIPGALEAYYQEAGRAGRDGKRSYAVLVYRERDEDTQRGLIEESHPAPDKIQAIYDAVCNQERIALGDQPVAPLTIHLASLAHRTSASPALIRAAVDELVRNEVWAQIPRRRHMGHLHFLQPMASLMQYARETRNPDLAALIEILARTVHADAFSDLWEIDLRLLERKTGLIRSALSDKLDFLASREFLRWIPPGAQLKIMFLQPRAKRLNLEMQASQKARKRSLVRLEDMMRYTRSVTCRRHFLLQYFGEASPESCGACDICLGRHQPVVVTPAEEPTLRYIMTCVQGGIPLESWDLAKAGGSRPIRTGLLKWLVQEGYLVRTAASEETYRVTPRAESFLREWQPAGGTKKEESKGRS